MPRERGTDGCSLMIRKLSTYARESDLRYEAEKYGKVRDVYIVKDYHTGRPRGLAFIEFCDPRDCEEAADGMDGMEICDRPISCNVAQESRKRADEIRRDDRGGGYGRDRDRGGYDRGGPDRGYDRGYDRGGYDRAPDRGGYDRGGYDRGGYDRGRGGGGYDRDYDQGRGGYDRRDDRGYERERRRSYSRSPVRRSPSPRRRDNRSASCSPPPRDNRDPPMDNGHVPDRDGDGVDERERGNGRRDASPVDDDRRPEAAPTDDY